MKNYLILFGLLCGLSLSLFSQTANTQTDLYCAWESVSMKNAPGKVAKTIGVIRFGEVVRWNGESQYVADESRTYLKVQAVDGAVGWVHEYLFVKGIGLGVILQGGLIYKRPQTVTTVTTDQFLPGELVIVEGFTNNWVGISGKRKAKKGWIEGQNKVSMEDRDVLLASLMMSVEAEKDPQKRQKQMELVYQQANQVGSPMAEVVRSRSGNNNSNNNPPLVSSAAKQNTRDLSTSSPSQERPMPTVEENNPNRYFRSVKDPQTGLVRRETVEMGGIYLVNGPSKTSSIYFAYHKSLPIGSTIRIQIPNTQGFVELKVVSRLRNDNPAMVGLHPECVQAIFGDYVPKEISIIYPQASMQP
ncbi:MAG: SH3 domain-containing protein [Bacteroidota bacterium]